MTKKDIKNGKQYKVQLSAPAEIAGKRFYPGQNLRLRGDAVKAHWDAVADAKEV